MAKTQDPVAELQGLQSQIADGKKKLKKSREKAKRLFEELEETIQMMEELEEEEIMMSTKITAQLKQAKAQKLQQPDAKLGDKVKTWAGKVGAIKLR
jgi:predicted nuclease with TOPRIM domain